MNSEMSRMFVPAYTLAVLALLLGLGLGVAFGAAEDVLKGVLRAGAHAVLATVYAGDADKAKLVVDKSWVYVQRAHLHAGALGTMALAIALLLTQLPGALWLRRGVAVATALGALGYGVFWLLAGLRAPALGGTGAAKESLRWLAWPSSGLIVVGVLAVLVLVLRGWLGSSSLRPAR